MRNASSQPPSSRKRPSRATASEGARVVDRRARILRAVGAVACVGLALVLAGALWVVSSGPPADGSTGVRTTPGIYVSTSGTDTASGTLDDPLRTIQAAADRATPGETVFVRGGTYDERPVFVRSGTATAVVTYRPFGNERVVIAKGFDVAGDHNRVTGFTLTPGIRNSATGQIFIDGDHNTVDRIVQHDTYGTPEQSMNSAQITGSDNVLSNVDFHDCGPIVTTGPGMRNTISGGTIYHTGGIMAVLEGDYTVLKDMDMHDSGNTTSGQVDKSGNGSDAINLNGSHITISGNRIYRIFIHSLNQHEDSIQWWNTADDLVIENNTIGSRAKGGPYDSGDAGHIQFETGSAQRVLIRNNVFLGEYGDYVIRSSAGQVAPGTADDWQIVGNTFADGTQIRGDVLANMRRTRIVGNVFLQVQAFERGEGSVYDYNAYVGVPVPESEGPHSFRVSDPGFVNGDLSAATDFGLKADMRLRSDSPLAGAGTPLPSLPYDKSGTKRARQPSIGAYEAPSR